MPTFIVTVEFAHTDDAAFAVEAASRTQAVDHAMDRLIEDPHGDRPVAGHAISVAEFEDSFGAYTDGMFVKL